MARAQVCTHCCSRAVLREARLTRIDPVVHRTCVRTAAVAVRGVAVAPARCRVPPRTRRAPPAPPLVIALRALGPSPWRGPNWPVPVVRSAWTLPHAGGARADDYFGPRGGGRRSVYVDVDSTRTDTNMIHVRTCTRNFAPTVTSVTETVCPVRV